MLPLALLACAGHPTQPDSAARLQLDTQLPAFPAPAVAPMDAMGASSPVPSSLECLAEPVSGGGLLPRFQLSTRLSFKAPEPKARIVAPEAAAQQKAIALALAAQPKGPVRASQEQRADDLFLAGGEALLLGERDAAESAYRRTLELAPMHHDARVALAALLLDQRRTDEAALVIAPGLRSAPESPALRMLQARVRLAEGDSRSALDLLSASPPPIAGYLEYHALMAALQQRTGQHEAAAAIYRDLVQRRPGEGAWWVGLGISEEALRRYEEARSAYLRAAQTGRLAPALRGYADERARALGS